MSLPAGFDLSAWSRAKQSQVEQALAQWLTVPALTRAEAKPPVALIESMRYAVLDGGKRLRPLLVLAAAEAVASAPLGPGPGGVGEAALRAACAVELIHA